jgi:hypothetical protein
VKGDEYYLTDHTNNEQSALLGRSIDDISAALPDKFLPPVIVQSSNDELDSQRAIARGRDYLLGRVAAAGGKFVDEDEEIDQATKEASILLDLDLTPHKVFDLLKKHWNDHTEFPSCDEGLEISVRRAWDAWQTKNNPPLTLSGWASRNIPEQDLLLGNLLSTTSRGLLFAPTGIGKSLLCTALGLAIADGKPFFHWHGRRQSRVLYIDGEMSNRLVKQRLDEAIRRHGGAPAGFHYLCIADLEKSSPLNTKDGQAAIEKQIKRIGGVDFIIFDNVMSLIAGSMKEEDSWAEILPWVLSLTTRCIGQLWIHHTGHKEDQSYGTKTREWLLDLVMRLERVKRRDADISFKLTFSKARERTPDTWSDFTEIEIALINDKWTQIAARSSTKAKLNGTMAKYYEALKAVLAAGKGIEVDGRLVATIEAWRSECIIIGLLDRKKPASVRSLFSKYRKKLVEAAHVVCEGEYAWPCV